MSYRRTQSVVSRLEVIEQCESTNAELRARAADADAWPHLSVLLTKDQTAGRGRLDRSWIAPAGAALAISVVLRDLPQQPQAFGWIPLAAGVAMADAVAAQLSDHEVGLKWPNDVLVDDRKICGILAEAGGGAVIVGAGVNTRMTRAQLPVPTATSFALAGVEVDEDRLVADYIARLDDLLRGLSQKSDAVASGLHAAASSRCVTIGRDVDVTLPDGTALHATALRLEADGRLAVVANGSQTLVGAGDVVHARLR